MVDQLQFQYYMMRSIIMGQIFSRSILFFSQEHIYKNIICFFRDNILCFFKYRFAKWMLKEGFDAAGGLVNI